MTLTLTDGYVVNSLVMSGRNVKLNNHRTMGIGEFHKIGGIVGLFIPCNMDCEGETNFNAQPTEEALEWINQ